MRRLPTSRLIALAVGLGAALPVADGRAEKLPLPTIDYAAEGTVVFHQGGPTPGMIRHSRAKMRLDAVANGREMTVYFDFDEATTTIVYAYNGRKVAMKADWRMMSGAINARSIDARRVGEARFLGENCTIFEYATGTGSMLRVCITSDGVGLHSQEEGQLRWEATRVTRTPQAPALFIVPADAMPLQLPPMR